MQEKDPNAVLDSISILNPPTSYLEAAKAPRPTGSVKSDKFVRLSFKKAEGKDVEGSGSSETSKPQKSSSLGSIPKKTPSSKKKKAKKTHVKSPRVGSQPEISIVSSTEGVSTPPPPPRLSFKKKEVFEAESDSFDSLLQNEVKGDSGESSEHVIDIVYSVEVGSLIGKVTFQPFSVRKRGEKFLFSIMGEEVTPCLGDASFGWIAVDNNSKEVKSLEELASLSKRKSPAKENPRPVDKPTVFRPKGEPRRVFYKISDELRDWALQVLPEEFLEKHGDSQRLKRIALQALHLYGRDLQGYVQSLSWEELIKKINSDYNTKQKALNSKPNYSLIWGEIRNRYKGVSLLEKPNTKAEKAFRKEYNDLKKTIVDSKGPVHVLPKLGKKGTSRRSPPRKGGKKENSSARSLIDPSLLATLAVLKELKSVF